MLSENTLSLLRQNTTSENLVEVISYILEYVDPFIDDEIYQNLLLIKEKHTLLMAFEDANAIRVSPIAYEQLMQDFNQVLTLYESLPSVNRNNIEFQSVYTNIKDKNISSDSYSFLTKIIGLSLILIFIFSYFVLLYSLNLNYFDANWRKVFFFFTSGVAIYFILRICTNWILYFPKQCCSYELNVLDSEGELARVLRKEHPYKLKKNKYDWLQGWRLIHPIKKPGWVIHSKFLKWHLPIIEGFKSVMLPTIFAIGCLLVFQSYLNINFSNDNTFTSFGELVDKNERLDVIRNYVKLNNTGYSIFNKAYYASGLFVLLLIILSIAGAFLSKIQRFLGKYKLVSKTLKFLYFFFIILTTFSYSGNVADNFIGEKQKANDLKITILKHNFDALVCYIEEQLLEEQIVESILDNKKLEEVLEELEEHEKELEAGESEIGDAVFAINLMPIAAIGVADYIFEPNYSKKKTVHKLYDIFPDKPKPRQPNSFKSQKSSKSNYKYQFTSENAEKIWTEVGDGLNKEKIENIKKDFIKQKKDWNTKIAEKVKAKSKPLQNILGKYTGVRSQSGINIAGKIITKESFTQILNTFTNNEVAKILFRTMYEKAIDPKIGQYIIKQTNVIVKEVPNPPIVKTDVNTGLEKELQAIKELIKNEKIHIETHYKKQNKVLSKLKIKEEVKLEKQKKERKPKAKLNPTKSATTDPRVAIRKYALHNGRMLYTTDGLTYYDRSGKRMYVQPNGRAFSSPLGGDIPIPPGGISGAGSRRSTRSYGG